MIDHAGNPQSVNAISILPRSIRAFSSHAIYARRWNWQATRPDLAMPVASDAERRTGWIERALLVHSRSCEGAITRLKMPEMTHRAAPEFARISLTRKRNIQNAGREREHIVVRTFPTRLLGMHPQFLHRFRINEIKFGKVAACNHGFSVNTCSATPHRRELR